MSTPEYVRSAIRSVEHAGATVVVTSADRWLLVTGYHPAYQAWAELSKAGLVGDGPRVAQCVIVREASEAEFYRSCATVDTHPKPYREELTPHGIQLVLTGFERRSPSATVQLGLFA